MATAMCARPTPAQRPYRPYGSALDLMRFKGPEIVLSGPAGTGKSRACLEKLHLCALKYPGMRGLIVRKTRESLTESALVTFEEKVLPEGSPIAQGAQRANRQSYLYPNGSVIVVGGLRQSGRDMTQKVMSTEYDMVYAQEAIELTEGEWEKITTRLRNGVMPYQQIIADTNPDSPTHWLKRRADAGRARMLESRHEENPVYWDAESGDWTAAGLDYVVGKLGSLSGVRRDRLRFGRWVKAEGTVYEGWDRSVHLIESMPRGWEVWRKIRSIDFGYTNPFVCGWWAVDPDGRMYLYRELYMTGRTVAVHAQRIKALSGAERYEATVADHDAEDRATLQAEGIPTIAAFKAISPGIQATQERLQVAGDGRSRLYVLEDALVERDDALAEARKPTSTAEEFDSYIWPKGQDGRAMKEVPVDADNHGMDQMRYAVAYVDHLGPPAQNKTPVRGRDPFARCRG